MGRKKKVLVEAVADDEDFEEEEKQPKASLEIPGKKDLQEVMDKYPWDEGQYRCELYRDFPTTYKNHNCKGFVVATDYPISEKWIEEHYGGQTYNVKIRGPHPKTGAPSKWIDGCPRVVVSGPPKRVSGSFDEDEEEEVEVEVPVQTGSDIGPIADRLVSMLSEQMLSSKSDDRRFLEQMLINKEQEASRWGQLTTALVENKSNGHDVSDFSEQISKLQREHNEAMRQAEHRWSEGKRDLRAEFQARAVEEKRSYDERVERREREFKDRIDEYKEQIRSLESRLETAIGERDTAKYAALEAKTATKTSDKSPLEQVRDVVAMSQEVSSMLGGGGAKEGPMDQVLQVLKTEPAQRIAIGVQEALARLGGAKVPPPPPPVQQQAWQQIQQQRLAPSPPQPQPKQEEPVVEPPKKDITSEEIFALLEKYMTETKPANEFAQAIAQEVGAPQTAALCKVHPDVVMGEIEKQGSRKFTIKEKNYVREALVWGRTNIK